ncbi:conserved hypothetical protein [Burkholderia pseudomallei Pakistan 9]|uniref:Uncharacterized protein n=2 Tax=Burkholderia pseudomallei TaxID=28450 RepID=A0A0E1W360_BURPE|nr:conserved hypothetical protein [Burkholderia pseudomallei 1106a]EDO91657.1 conserved hypothetical protein [Burkholderia pseudomallei Pasteur 52237]EEH25361.1 conserved hypothetical protein [Burkholderia pseudomallei Pakistan 9]EET06731.1 conserved hypothetical protein [Burkholderia pseudomallei 1710a]
MVRVGEARRAGGRAVRASIEINEGEMPRAPIIPEPSEFRRRAVRPLGAPLISP